MKKLEKGNFKKVLKLANKSNRKFPFVYSVIEGIQEGEIFVDNRKRPSMALVHFGLGLLYVLVDESKNPNIKEICKWIVDDFETSAPSKILFSPILSIENELKNLLGEKVNNHPRSLFSLNTEIFLSRFNTITMGSNNFIMKPIDKDIALKVF